MREYYIQLTYWLDPFFLIYFGIINTIYCILLFLGSISIYRRYRDLNIEVPEPILKSNSLPEITFLMPAYNEGSHLVEAINNVLHLSYRYKQLILVNDGSTDNTLEILKEKYQLIQIPCYFQPVVETKPIRGVYRSKIYSELLVIDKENGRRFDALNAGLGACKNDYTIAVDADTFIDDHDFEMLVRPMMMNPETIAIGASVRIRNGCVLEYNRVKPKNFPASYLAGLQTLEYLRAFILRQGWNLIGCTYLISGAFSIYMTKWVVKVGGFALIGEDLEMVLKLNRYMRAKKIPYKMDFLPDPVSWTDAPSTYQEISKQRISWNRGFFGCLWCHKSLLFNPRYGRYGFLVFPFLIYAEAIEPIVELMGIVYIIFGLYFDALNVKSLILVLVMIYFFTTAFTLMCILVEEMTFKRFEKRKSTFLLVFYSLIENFGYRQLNLLWRLHGIFEFLIAFPSMNKDSKRVNQWLSKNIAEAKTDLANKSDSSR